MATIPERFEILKKNIRSILEQEDVIFDKLLIIVNKYDSDDILKKYDEIKALSPKYVDVVLGENKWKSCNKAIYPIVHYPNKTFITVDDDICYYPHALYDLLVMHEKYPDCIITHETNPVRITDTGFIEYFNTWQTKFKQRCFDKYLTCCSLFPAHTFDNTDVLNYDKMIELTNGMHDELWLWVNSSVKGVKSICLNHTLTFVLDDVIAKDDNALGATNGQPEKIIEYNLKVNAQYGEQLRETFKSNTIDFVVTEDNFYGILNMMNQLAAMYKNYKKMTFDVSKLAKSYQTIFTNNIRNFLPICEIKYE
jgi:hypothetical protein